SCTRSSASAGSRTRLTASRRIQPACCSSPSTSAVTPSLCRRRQKCWKDLQLCEKTRVGWRWVRSFTASVVLASYAATVLLLPVLHRLHHQRHGNDHVHTAIGTIYFDEATHHAAFDADLTALDLDEVAHAGALEIDCELSRYTLASCDDSLPPSHP